MTNEELVDQIQKGINSGNNMELLYIQNKGLINKTVKRFKYVYYVNNSKASLPIIEYQELMNEAYFGLAEAAQRYENTAGVLFMTYAQFWIRQAIARYIDAYRCSIHLPLNLQEKIKQYRKVINVYNSQLYREPTDEELCLYLKCKMHYLEKLKRTIQGYGNIDSLDRDLPGEEGLRLSDSINSDIDIENQVIDKMMERSLNNELWQIVKENTTEQENDIIRCRYIRNMSLGSIGIKYNLTRERIRQIEAKGLKKLRRTRVIRELEDKFEVNYARCYRGGLSDFRYTGKSIVEDIAIRNLEAESSAIQ